MSRVRRASGFTIVELLIVVVVIGILASITIVSYGGITDRARAVKAQASARAIAEKIEIWNATMGYYPTFEQIYTHSVAPTGSGTSAVAGGATGPLAAELPSSLSYTKGNHITGDENLFAIPDCRATGDTTGPIIGGIVVYNDPTSEAAVAYSTISWGRGGTLLLGSGINCDPAS